MILLKEETQVDTKVLQTPKVEVTQTAIKKVEESGKELSESTKTSVTKPAN